MPAHAARRRILSLWLPRLSTDRIRRGRAAKGLPAAPDELANEPCVVVAKEHNALQIAALNAAAARLGLVTGLPLANARAICPQLDVVDADPDADHALLEDVADWCDRFTPLVAFDPPNGLLLDITGCAHLFGGEAGLLQKLHEGIARQGFAVSAAVAGTPVCARAAAYGRSGSIVPQGHESAAMASLPVALLGASEAITRGLIRAGLKTIGDVASRTTPEISARFGMAFTALLAQALGQGDTPISPRRPLPDFTAERRFAEPVATEAVIAATLASLAQVLAERMLAQGKGARRLEARFFRADGAVRGVAVLAGHPTRDAAIMARLFSERFDALADPLDPGFGFDLIRLAAHDTVPLDDVQSGFDTAAHEAADVGRLVDRLAARIGTRRVVRYLPQDTHLPERVDASMPAQHVATAAGLAHKAWPVRIAGEPPLRPLRLFARPQFIDVVAEFPHGPPATFRWRRDLHRLVHVEGPERIACEWWMLEAQSAVAPDDGGMLPFAPHEGAQDIAPVDGRRLTRDYFRGEDEAGLRFWMYREGIHRREVTTFRWFLHGLFA